MARLKELLRKIHFKFSKNYNIDLTESRKLMINKKN